MQNKLLALIENQQIEKVKQYKVKEKDKEGNEVEKELTRQIDDFQVGDTVDVHQRILEGQKERTQVFSGVVIAMRGTGTRAMFTVRRLVQSEGVERIFPMVSPKIAKIEIKRRGRVRRAKLYYLRDRVGKATRLRERKKGIDTVGQAKATAAANAAANPTPTPPAPQA
jgi:large subunit ribosomal protein L19